MTQLQKAKLQEVSADQNQSPIGDPVPVQFNPSSLRLKLTNQSDGGRSRGRQRRQNNGQSSTVLSMDLVFDTADEGTADAPVSVRTKTSEVEKFVLPKQDGGETPPRLQFQWDKLIIAGIVESLDIEFDHFAENGAPLRARVSLSIKEQEPKYTYLQSGRGSKGSANASNPGGMGAATPGGGTNEPTAVSKPSDRSAQALENETAAEFLARQGLDPAAWRGLDADLGAGLTLKAGVDIGFGAALSVGAGVGMTGGANAGGGVSLAASLGINGAKSGDDKINATSPTKKIDGDAAGLALSAAGGVEAAIASVKKEQAGNAVSTTQSAFGVAPAVGKAASSASGNGAASASAVARGASAKTSASSLAEITGGIESTVDTRAISYGFGVPLRPQYGVATTQQSFTLCASLRASDSGPQFAKQRTTAPWVELPARVEARQRADRVEAKKRRSPCEYHPHPCSCHGD